jgi:hypothetical protein
LNQYTEFNGFLFWGGPLDILGGKRGNSPCKKFFEFEALSEFFFEKKLCRNFFKSVTYLYSLSTGRDKAIEKK